MFVIFEITTKFYTLSILQNVFTKLEILDLFNCEVTEVEGYRSRVFELLPKYVYSFLEKGFLILIACSLLYLASNIWMGTIRTTRRLKTKTVECFLCHSANWLWIHSINFVIFLENEDENDDDDDDENDAEDDDENAAGVGEVDAEDDEEDEEDGDDGVEDGADDGEEDDEEDDDDGAEDDEEDDEEGDEEDEQVPGNLADIYKEQDVSF